MIRYVLLNNVQLNVITQNIMITQIYSVLMVAHYAVIFIEFLLMVKTANYINTTVTIIITIIYYYYIILIL